MSKTIEDVYEIDSILDSTHICVVLLIYPDNKQMKKKSETYKMWNYLMYIRKSKIANGKLLKKSFTWW